MCVVLWLGVFMRRCRVWLNRAYLHHSRCCYRKTTSVPAPLLNINTVLPCRQPPRMGNHPSFVASLAWHQSLFLYKAPHLGNQPFFCFTTIILLDLGEFTPLEQPVCLRNSVKIWAIWGKKCLRLILVIFFMNF